MKLLWDWLDQRTWRAAAKYRMALLLLSVLFGLGGALVWSIVQIWTLKTTDWLICFVGYPVLVSWYLGIVYGYNHCFHDKK